MPVISRLAPVLGDRVLGGGRGVPGLRFAGEGMEGEGRQASLQDVSIRDPRVHSSRAPAILDGAAPPLTSQTPSPCNASQPLVLRVPSATLETQVEPKPPTQPTPSVEEASAAVLKTVEPKPPTHPKQSVEEASAAVLQSLLSRDKAKADKAAERAAVKAEAKKAAKAAAMVATKAGATTTGKAKPEEVTPKPKKAPPEEDPADTKKTPSNKKLATDIVKDSSMFRIDHERSIPQWLLRTGWKQPFGPGSKGFR